MNTRETIIIPTVGMGGRMGDISRSLNKALLPYKNKPIISHIIAAFPADSKFIIPIGYLADQVISYFKVAHANLDVEFVYVTDWTSETSGTAKTLLACDEYIDGPFWYVSCDTYFHEDIIKTKRDCDCFYVGQGPTQTPEDYTMFKLESDYVISDIKFKTKVSDEWRAFSGLMYIYDIAEFFESLNNTESIEVISVIPLGAQTSTLPSWIDLGTEQKYNNAQESSLYNFSKPEEITYVGNDIVVKWWKDPAIAEQKYKKAIANPRVFPENVRYSGNFLAYDFYEGHTLYNNPSPDHFPKLLSWLSLNLWNPTNDNITQSSLKFYKEKSLDRISLFLERHQDLYHPEYINGVRVKSYQEYLNSIDWDYLSNNSISSFIHGDLQFDNIIVNGDNFVLIDWRHTFADLRDTGDLYYDLSKLLGGLIIQYSEIKKNNFSVTIDKDNKSVKLDIPSISQLDTFKYQLRMYSLAHNLEFKKIELLVPIIFCNMAPLHTPPFDIFLWYLGIMLFAGLND